jgi:hypothetical protein
MLPTDVPFYSLLIYIQHAKVDVILTMLHHPHSDHDRAAYLCCAIQRYKYCHLENMNWM